DTPMMKSNRAGPELGFSREPAAAVADAIVEGIEADAFEVIRGGETRARMIDLNRDNPAAVDERFLASNLPRVFAWARRSRAPPYA
ncbi:MAG TPA: oxidoreductase, partial [Xanthobacteraceae bacterium]|nr:oxidoreductase [Xanthobacteraceae bacterium]